MTTTQPNSAPIALGAGSYDYDALKNGTDAAAKAPDGEYDQRRDEALEKARKGDATAVDPRDIPGYRFKAVKHSELGVTETIQVFDPELAAEAAEAGEAEAPAPKKRTRRKRASSSGAATGGKAATATGAAAIPPQVETESRPANAG
jgi:hypothetical protein